jgi:hypothetical protein
LQSIRPKVEAALAATAERLSPGSGSKAVRHAKNDLATIDGSSEDLSRRYANEDIAIAVPAVFEAKHPDGDPVTIDKKHDGVIIVFPDSFIFVRGIGFGAREVKAVDNSEVSVEQVTMVLDGANVPGLRITGRSGKPKFAAAIALPGDQNDPNAQEAVRDEIYSLFKQ